VTAQHREDLPTPGTSGVSPPEDEGAAHELAFAALQATAALVLICDGDGRLLLGNPALERFTGLPAADLVGRALWEVVVIPEDEVQARLSIAGAMAGRPSFPKEVDWLAAADRRRRVELQSSVLLDAAGRPYAIAYVGIDVTEQRAREARTHRRATTDSLTGVGNRSVLFDALRQHLDPDTGGGCGLLFCDLDGFKGVNDEHGHVIGDQLLVEVASRLRELAGPDDVVARFGGDEFVLLRPGLDDAGLVDLTARAGIRMHAPFTGPAGPLPVGVSIGSAAGRPGDTADDVVARADAEMYGAKSNRHRRQQPRVGSGGGGRPG
jgi:cyclic di-GMP phosphodiesterase Gmr